MAEENQENFPNSHIKITKIVKEDSLKSPASLFDLSFIQQLMSRSTIVEENEKRQIKQSQSSGNTCLAIARPQNLAVVESHYISLLQESSIFNFQVCDETNNLQPTTMTSLPSIRLNDLIVTNQSPAECIQLPGTHTSSTYTEDLLPAVTDACAQTLEVCAHPLEICVNTFTQVSEIQVSDTTAEISDATGQKSNSYVQATDAYTRASDLYAHSSYALNESCRICSCGQKSGSCSCEFEEIPLEKLGSILDEPVVEIDLEREEILLNSNSSDFIPSIPRVIRYSNSVGVVRQTPSFWSRIKNGFWAFLNGVGDFFCNNRDFFVCLAFFGGFVVCTAFLTAFFYEILTIDPEHIMYPTINENVYYSDHNRRPTL